MIGNSGWDEVVKRLSDRVASPNVLPYVSQLARNRPDPFYLLISTMISLRTKDDVTESATERLWRLAPSPQQLAALMPGTIAAAIYPAGFYRTKAQNIRETARIVQQQHGGLTPRTREALLRLPGVGRKTANLVLGLAFGIPAICVDTHVHRIANRAGWIQTATPAASEEALVQTVPRRHWIMLNEILVAYGQALCTPQSPFCSRCVIADYCIRRGVTRSR